MTKANTNLDPDPDPLRIDFTDTKIAFSTKSNAELTKAFHLFSLMNKSWLVNSLSTLGLYAVKWNLPLARWAVRQTIFEQFCGGENLLDCQQSIDKLYKHNVLTVLDYGAEAKDDEDELNAVMEEFIKAIEFAASNNSVPVISIKVSGLTTNELLEKLNKNVSLTAADQEDYDQLRERLAEICDRAYDLGVGIFVDAEESWYQIAIDNIVRELMQYYNDEKVIVYNTYQLYRHDKLDQLKKDYAHAISNGYLLGAKLVRGAYMNKERERAEEEGYPSPIHKDKSAVDHDFNEALRFCIDHYEDLAFCNASHNADSNRLMASIIAEKGLQKDHPHLNFCQLYGMSDNITFNLADADYNVAKYVPYGPIKEVIPYLIRRAEENSSVTGDMSRELQLLKEEMQRRGL